MTLNVFGGRKALTQIVYSVHVRIYVYLLGVKNYSLTCCLVSEHNSVLYMYFKQIIESLMGFV